MRSCICIVVLRSRQGLCSQPPFLAGRRKLAGWPCLRWRLVGGGVMRRLPHPILEAAPQRSCCQAVGPADPRSHDRVFFPRAPFSSLGSSPRKPCLRGAAGAREAHNTPSASSLLRQAASPRHLAGWSCPHATGGSIPLARPVSRTAGSRPPQCPLSTSGGRRYTSGLQERTEQGARDPKKKTERPRRSSLTVALLGRLPVPGR